MYSHQLCVAQRWLLQMQQGEILSCSLPVSHTLPWRLCGWRLLSPWLSQRSYKQETRTVLRHPGRVLSSTLPSFCPSRGDRSSIYPATTMDPLLVHDLKCPEQLVGQSCGLWPLAKGSLMVKPDPKLQSRKWQPNQAPQCWPNPMTFLLSQDPA